MDKLSETDIEKNINVYTTKKAKRRRKEGAGIFDDIGNFFKKGYEKVKTFFDPYSGYRPRAQDIIKKYGGMNVVKIYAFRKPIMSVLNTVLNLISDNKFDEGKKLANYDEMYHLGLIFVLQNNTHIMVEKNERIDMDVIRQDTIKNYGELLPIYLKRPITFGQILENAQKGMGNKYFDYSAFDGNNCQVYAKSLLEYSGLLTPEADAFIFQPLDKILEKLPKSTPKIANAVTKLGAFFANIGSKITGKGDGYELHAVVVKKPVSLEELAKIQKEFVGNKKFIRETKQSYRIRNIPKQKFYKDSFRSEKIKGKNITLVYGKLKNLEGGVVSKDMGQALKERVPAKIKEAYDIISSLPKIPSGKKPVIARTKEERAKLRKDWEEEHRDEMLKILHMTPDERKAYIKEKTDEYNAYMSKPEVRKATEEAKKKEEAEYGQKAVKMVEKAKKFSSVRKLIDELKSKKQQLKQFAEKYTDREQVKKIMDDYNDDMKKIEDYDFYNISNTQLRDQLDKQYLKMWNNMLERPKIYGDIPANKEGYTKADKRYIRQVYEKYGKPEPDLLIDIFDTVSDVIGMIPGFGDIYTPINDLIQGQIRKGDAPKESEAVPEVDYEKGYDELHNLEQNVERAQNIQAEINPLEQQQQQLEQQQREIVGSGGKDFRKLLKELNVPQKKYLEIMTKIARKNGYNKPLKISTDGEHKLEYDGVKFGKSDYMDYILYYLTEGQEVANKHRKNYLARTAKMRGNWKKNDLSANNLARRIIWDEKNII